MPWAFPTAQLKKRRLLGAETLWGGLILKPGFHSSEMEYKSRMVGKEEVADPGRTHCAEGVGDGTVEARGRV